MTSTTKPPPRPLSAPGVLEAQCISLVEGGEVEVTHAPQRRQTSPAYMEPSDNRALRHSWISFLPRERSAKPSAHITHTP